MNKRMFQVICNRVSCGCPAECANCTHDCISACAVASNRSKSHALYTIQEPTDRVTHAPIARGDITVHNERVMHGSGPNLSLDWRKAYVLAFRKHACVAEERAMGFTHSHNDVTSWDSFSSHRQDTAAAMP